MSAFNWVHLYNFKSHVDSYLPLRNRGVCLIAGEVIGSPGVTSNGAGKTSLLPDAPLFALFGRTLNGARGDDVINRAVGRNCLVECSIEHNGDALVISRPVKHSKVKRAQVTIGSEVYRGADEVARIVQEILGVSFETATAAIVFGRGDTNFFTQRSDAERKAVLDELMGIERISVFYKTTQTRLEATRSALVAKSSALTAARSKVDGLRAGLESLRRQQAEFSAWRAERQAEIDAVRAQTTQNITEGQAAEAEANRLLQEATDAYAALDAPLHRAEEEAADAAVGLSTATGALHRAERELADLEAERNRVVQLAPGTKCPTCLGEISQDQQRSVLGELSSRYAAALSRRSNAEANQRAATETAGRTNSTLLALRESAAKLKELVDGHKTAQGQALRQQQDSQLALSRCTGMEADLAKAAEPAEKEIAELERQVAASEADIRTLDQERAALADESAYLVFWEKGFSQQGLKNMLLANALPFLNGRANHYSDLLADGLVSVTFSTVSTLKSGETRDKLDVQVRVANGGDSYKMASDGQRRRADLIAAFALGDLAASRLSSPLDILVLDELFEGLDEAGVERAIALLHVLGRERSSVFCTTHLPDLAQHFPTVIRVVNRDGISSIA